MNVWCGTGRLTKDVEIYNRNTTVGKFTVAVDRQFKKEGQPEADFLRVVTFGKTAENCARFIGKGRLVGITGRIQTGSYQDKETGKMVYTTDVIADNVQFLDYAKDNQEQAESGGYAPGDHADDDLPF